MNTLTISGSVTNLICDNQINQTGTGANYSGGNPGGLVDSGEVGLAITGSDNYHLENGVLQNISGTAVDIQLTAGSWQHVGKLSNFSVRNSYRGFHLHNYGEYEVLSDCSASNCIWGFKIESGSHIISNAKVTYSQIGVQIIGTATQNDSHGVWTGLISNHCTYNLSCVDVALGEVFNGCCFIGGQSGGYDAGGGIQLVNARGIILSGSQIAYIDISVDATSVLSLIGCVFRGPCAITVAGGGVLNAKSNIVMAGATLTLNGAAFTGNN